MKAVKTGNITIITDDQGNAEALLMKLTHEYVSFSQQHLIVDLCADQSLTAKKLAGFSKIATMHKKSKHSFVIVASGVDFNALPAVVNAVPTLQEAHDLIELEEIERDLGF
jgi:hypothetical protein